MKLLDLAIKHDFTCYWCHKKFRLEELSRDHINPLNKHHRPGGSNRWGNIGSCVLSCKVCNQSRGNIPFFIYKGLKNI